ncbi:MAG: ATP-binding cassette domain-containing protein, partial [Sphingomonadales bacterium]|nr:ATP-binding cassette domain-containing protein [Sphingomonadales bacterium]
GDAQAAFWRERSLPGLLAMRSRRPIATGEIVTFGTDHIAAIRAHGATFLPARLAASVGPAVVLALVAAVSWVAAAILSVTFAVFILAMILAGTAARKASDWQLAALAGLSAIFVDRLTHLPLIRHFGAEDRVGRQVEAATGSVAAQTLAVLRIAFLSTAVLEFAAALAVALVAVYCGFALLGLLPFRVPETLGLARAIFVLVMAPEFYLPMRRLAAAYHEKQLGEAAMAALDALGDEAPPPAMPTAGQAWRGLGVRGLTIAFPGTAIGPVSFTLGAAGLVALTGATGAGKSSVLAAIAGLLAPDGGVIADHDGAPIAPALVAVSAQQPLLLAGTLATNLALAAPDASRAEILAVAEQVGLGPVLARRGDGLDMAIDPRGSGLSGGERKRIGIGRALLSGRPLLLLDEPTADLDAGSAEAIARLIAAIAQTRPVVCATHDARLVRLAACEVAL